VPTNDDVSDGGKRKKKKKGKRSQRENLDDLKREMEMVCFFLCSVCEQSFGKLVEGFFFPAADAYSVSSVITIVLETQPYQITPE